MNLLVVLEGLRVRVNVATDEEKSVANICIDTVQFTQDADEPTESAIVRLLVDIENATLQAYKQYDPCSDEYSLREDIVRQLKVFYPAIQSMIRRVKRRTASHREINLKNYKKELNIK